MRIVSFNVNGLRARPHQLERLVENLAPDIIGLQEIKVRDEEFPADLPQRLGYHAEWLGQPTHYGVALLSRTPPLAVRKGLPGDGPDAQRRLISADYATRDGGQITVLNGYFPQGESRDHAQKFPAKRAFYAGLLRLLREEYSPGRKLAVVGDMNIAPVDLDIGIGAENAKRWLKTGKCSFLPEEREWMGDLMGWGLTDCFRALHPEIDDRFSWFDYRSRGFEQAPRRGLRIDLILATASLAAHCTGAGIDYDIRAMERPSDHCPVWADFSL